MAAVGLTTEDTENTERKIMEKKSYGARESLCALCVLCGQFF
jgi:hypothetical protein